jgi:ABC-type polysaccharide/polyol phosphate export permease
MIGALTGRIVQMGGALGAALPWPRPTSSRPPRWQATLTGWVDAVFAFIALEKALILRNIRMVAGANISRAFIASIRLYVVIDAHVYLYWAINRAMPGTISFLDYNAGGFALWALFSSMTHKAVSPAVSAPFNTTLNIRWINLFVADFVWEVAKVLLALGLAYGQFLVFPQRSVSLVSGMPNIPLFAAMLLLVALLGSGFGLVLSSARKRWPVIDATMEAAMWFLFVTSGIYESYVQLPAQIGDYFRLNPVMVIVEYSRVALDKGYPVGDLSLSYPIIVTAVLLVLGLLLRDRTRTVRA